MKFCKRAPASAGSSPCDCPDGTCATGVPLNPDDGTPAAPIMRDQDNYDLAAVLHRLAEQARSGQFSRAYVVVNEQSTLSFPSDNSTLVPATVLTGPIAIRLEP